LALGTLLGDSLLYLLNKGPCFTLADLCREPEAIKPAPLLDSARLMQLGVSQVIMSLCVLQSVPITQQWLL